MTIAIDNHLSVLDATAEDIDLFESLVSTFYTVGNGQNRVLYVFVTFENNNGAKFLGASYDNLPMTFAEGTANDLEIAGLRTAYFYLLDPPSGTHEIVVLFDKENQGGVGLAAISLTGVDQSAPDPLNNTGSAVVGTNPFSIDVVTTNINDWIIAYGTHTVENFLIQADDDQTTVQNKAGLFAQNLSYREVASPGTTAISWTAGNPNGRFVVAYLVASPALASSSSSSCRSSSSSSKSSSSSSSSRGSSSSCSSSSSSYSSSSSSCRSSSSSSCSSSSSSSSRSSSSSSRSSSSSSSCCKSSSSSSCRSSSSSSSSSSTQFLVWIDRQERSIND